MKRIYVAGPMTNIPKHNFPEFDAARDRLNRRGWDAVSPADIDRSIGITENTTFEEVLPRMKELFELDLKALATCDAIFMLRGWEASSGATAEWATARRMGISIYYQETI